MGLEGPVDIDVDILFVNDAEGKGNVRERLQMKGSYIQASDRKRSDWLGASWGRELSTTNAKNEDKCET